MEIFRVRGGNSYSLQIPSPGGSYTSSLQGREGRGAEKDPAGESDSSTETNPIRGFGPQTNGFTPYQSQFPNRKVREIIPIIGRIYSFIRQTFIVTLLCTRYHRKCWDPFTNKLKVKQDGLYGALNNTRNTVSALCMGLPRRYDPSVCPSPASHPTSSLPRPSFGYSSSPSFHQIVF